MSTITEYSARPKRLLFPRAPNGGRLVAYLIDQVIGCGPVIMAWILNSLFHVTQSTATIVFNFFATLAWALYYALTKDGHGNGQSIAKKMFGLMVINSETGEPCSLGQSVERGLITVLLSAIPLVGSLIEPVAVLANDDGRRLGDRAANTQVIAVSVYQARVEGRSDATVPQ